MENRARGGKRHISDILSFRGALFLRPTAKRSWLSFNVKLPKEIDCDPSSRSLHNRKASNAAPLLSDAADIHEYDSDPMSRLGAYGISHMRRTGVPNVNFLNRRSIKSRKIGERRMATLPRENEETEIADRWSAGQALRQQIFGAATEMMPDVASVRPGSRVLDVAAGASEQTHVHVTVG